MRTHQMTLNHQGKELVSAVSAFCSLVGIQHLHDYANTTITRPHE